MKKYYLILPILIAFTFVACKQNSMENENKMMITEKLQYAQDLDFEVEVYLNGKWVSGDLHSIFIPLNSLDSDLEANLYNEIQFVCSQKMVTREMPSIIFAWPNSSTVVGIINAINWDAHSLGIDLSDFDLHYPVTIQALISEWENINKLINYDPTLLLTIYRFARDYGNDGSRIDFELARLRDGGEGRKEHIYEILDQLNLTEDEGAILLRQSGSYDAFVFITNLMLEEGLSFERARRRYERETSSTNVTDYGSLHAQQIIRVDTMLFNS